MFKELSIVVPLYNEQDRLLDGYDKIKKFCENNIENYEIILVNDGSSDGTWKVLNDLMARVAILII